MHENLRDKCNELGCSINDYIVGCIELMLDGSSEFDFGEEEETGSSSDKKQEKPKVVIRLD